LGYDHRPHAGNQGDVVKHVAFVAALDTVLGSSRSQPFRYADTFAGRAFTEIIEEHRSRGGWGGGIGHLKGHSIKFDGNRHVQWWKERYLAHDNLLGAKYPGSSVIARDVCESRNMRVHLSLWDSCGEVSDDLRREFDPNIHHIFGRKAESSEVAVREANFLLIDPPGLKSDRQPEYPPWETIRQFLIDRPGQQAVLLWLPVNAVTRSKPPGENQASWDARNDAIRLGCRAIRIRWAWGGTTIGCHLVYHLPDKAEKALREAVECVVEAEGWRARLPAGLQCIIL